jgi:hypothetical protein
MEGAAEGKKRQADLAFWTAWHVEAFARMEGRAFKNALDDRFANKTTTAANNHAQAIAFFHRLKARGVPVEITRH